MYRNTYVSVNLSKIKHNIAALKKITRDLPVMAVVKADAYGHGVKKVAEAAREAGVCGFAVATAEEALELRENGFAQPVLILGICASAAYRPLVENDISFCKADAADLELIQHIARKTQKKAKLHAKVDTGMGRIGFREKDAFQAFLQELKTCPDIELEGIFTHFATADCADKAYTRTQYERFCEYCDITKKHGFSPIRHCANSAAAAELAEMHMDMVRYGISMYGSYPSGEVDRSTVDLQQAMTLKTHIVFLKTIHAGDTVSYGRKFTAKSDRRIATLPIGYADGYKRALTGKAEVLVRGQRAPVVGTICMDQIMVDVTEVQGVSVGDEVVLMGMQGADCISAEELAEKAGTISYEIYTSISKRVPRVYCE